MATFKMNTDTWDIEFTQDGDIEILKGAEECTQDSRFRTQIIAGEMFDDTRKGVPWLTDMVSPALSLDGKKRILSKVILSTPNAVKLNYINISVNTDGEAICDYEGVTTNNEPFGGLLNGVNN
ncbi:hypothetical protein pA_gene0060 [Vibrio phage 13VT501A]|nr:hypothetical protein pA_gene0060 [Vibrio phage 13VT501A]